MVICKYFQQGCCKYGSNCRFEHVFGSKYSYSRGSQQPTVNQYNVFNQGSENSAASSLFRSAVQNNVPSVFNQNQTRPSVFSRLGHQPNSYASHESQMARSIFAQASQNTFGQANVQVPQNRNSFTSNAKSVFSQANQSVFAQTQQSIPPQHKAANLFASAAQSVFNTQNSQPVQNPSGSVFHISKPSNIFSIANNSFDMCDENLYSDLEELSKTDIAAFESAEFKLGCIPELPPPRTLCV